MMCLLMTFDDAQASFAETESGYPYIVRGVSELCWNALGHNQSHHAQYPQSFSPADAVLDYIFMVGDTELRLPQRSGC